MHGGERAKRERAAVAEDGKKEEVEEHGDGHIGGDGGEEKEPSGAPRLGMAPPEADDRWVLGKVIP